MLVDVCLARLPIGGAGQFAVLAVLLQCCEIFNYDVSMPECKHTRLGQLAIRAVICIGTCS